MMKKLTESGQIQSRWREYIEDLYDKVNKPQNDGMELIVRDADSIGPDILYEEFEKALAELKKG